MPPTSGSAGKVGRHAAGRPRGARPGPNALVIVCLVAYLAVTRRDVQPDGFRTWPAARAPGA